MNRWCEHYRARRDALQASFEALDRFDLPSLRAWFALEGLDDWVADALGPPRTALFGGADEPDVEVPDVEAVVRRLAAGLSQRVRTGRAVPNLVDWLLSQLNLEFESALRTAAGASMVRAIERELACYGEPADRLTVDAAFAETVAAALDSAGTFEPGRPLEPWLARIARRVVRAQVDPSARRVPLPSVDVDPRELGSMSEPGLDAADEQDWIITRALRGATRPREEAALLAYVLGDGTTASELSQQLGVCLARLYKRASLARARLQRAARELGLQR